MKTDYFLALQGNVQSQILAEAKKGYHMNIIQNEIHKIVLQKNYDKNLILTGLSKVFKKAKEKGHILSENSSFWPNHSESIKLKHKNSRFTAFLLETLTIGNTSSQDSYCLKDASVDLKRIGDVLDVLSLIINSYNHKKSIKTIIADFLINAAFHNFFTLDNDFTKEQRQSFFGDAESLFYHENTYLSLFKVLEFFQKNDFDLSPQTQNNLKYSLLKYLTEYWCADFDEEVGPHIQEVGQEIIKLYIKEVLKDNLPEIDKFQKGLNKTFEIAAIETESAQVASSILSAALSKYSLEISLKTSYLAENKEKLTFKV